jgi:hypothetical protein
MMETDPSKRYMIEYKSILLDIIEKYKTFERVNLALFLKKFKIEHGKEGIDSEICAEVIKPERFTKVAHDIFSQEGEGEETFEGDSMQFESIFLNDMPLAKKKQIQTYKQQYMGYNNERRLEMLMQNPNLPDGLLLKFRKCKLS